MTGFSWPAIFSSNVRNCPGRKAGQFLTFEMELATRRADAQFGAGFDPIVKKVGRQPGRQVRLVRGGGLALYADAIVLWIGGVGERVGADDRLFLARNIQLEGEELPRQEGGQGHGVFRRQVE